MVSLQFKIKTFNPKRKENRMKKLIFVPLAFIVLTMLVCSVSPALAAKKPNILIIWGDDIGVHNISAYNHCVMGYPISF